MGNGSSQPEPSAQPSVVQKKPVPLTLCDMKPIDVVPAKHYMWRSRDEGGAKCSQQSETTTATSIAPDIKDTLAVTNSIRALSL